MRWVLIWICACNTNPLVVYIANTKEHCTQVREALYRETGSGYICARYHPDLQAEPVVILEVE